MCGKVPLGNLWDKELLCSWTCRVGYDLGLTSPGDLGLTSPVLTRVG